MLDKREKWRKSNGTEQKPVNGMKDILPAEMEIRDYVTSVIKDTYRSFGFTPIETHAWKYCKPFQQAGRRERETDL